MSCVKSRVKSVRTAAERTGCSSSLHLRIFVGKVGPGDSSGMLKDLEIGLHSGSQTGDRGDEIDSSL